MIVCMSRIFGRFYKKSEIATSSINQAINEVVNGNCIPLGHKLFKTRIASMHRGKRGAYRSIIYYRSGDLMVFLYLFAKNAHENITLKELKELIEFARLYDTMQIQSIEKAIKEERLTRWNYESK